MCRQLEGRINNQILGVKELIGSQFSIFPRLNSMKATTDPPSASPENDVIPPPAPLPQTINGEWYQIIIHFASQVLMHMKLWQSNTHTFPSASSTASHLLQLKTLLAKEQVQ